MSRRTKSNEYSAPVAKFKNDLYSSITRYDNGRRGNHPKLTIESRQYLAWMIDNKCLELEKANAGTKECQKAKKELIRQLERSGQIEFR